MGAATAVFGVLLLAALFDTQDTTDFMQQVYICEQDCKLQYDADVIECNQQPTCLDGAANDLNRCSCQCPKLLPDCSTVAPTDPLAVKPGTRLAVLGPAAVAPSTDVDFCYDQFNKLSNICKQMSMNSSKQCTCIKKSFNVICPCKSQATTTISTTTAISTSTWVTAVSNCTEDCKVQYDVDIALCESSYDLQQCVSNAADALATCGCSCKSRLPNAACSSTAPLDLSEAAASSTAVSVDSTTMEPSSDVADCYDQFRKLFLKCLNITESSNKCSCVSKSLALLCPCHPKITTTTTSITTTTTGPEPIPNMELLIECNTFCWGQKLDANDRVSVLSLAQCNCRCLGTFSNVSGHQLSDAEASTFTASPRLQYTATADVLYCYKSWNKTLENCSAGCNGTHPETCEWRCNKSFSEAVCECSAAAAGRCGLAVVLVVGLAVWTAISSKASGRHRAPQGTTGRHKASVSTYRGSVWPTIK